MKLKNYIELPRCCYGVSGKSSAAGLFLEFSQNCILKDNEMIFTSPTRKYPLNWPRWLGRILKLSGSLVRLKVINRPDFAAIKPVIFALWHQDDLGLLPHFGDSEAVILVSLSKDGEALGQAVETMGYRYTAGSSHKGALGGVLALKDALSSGKNIVLAADGPKGPRRVAKPGAAYLAAKTGAPILPVGLATNWALHFNRSWNRTRWPLPLAKAIIVFGDPMYLPPEAARWPIRRQSLIVGDAIEKACRQAELILGSSQKFNC